MGAGDFLYPLTPTSLLLAVAPRYTTLMEPCGKWLRRPKKRHLRAAPKTKAQIDRSMAERQANHEAAKKGEPLPHPNIWDSWDPTKLPRDATDEEISKRYREFSKLCPPPRTKRHTI
jgi:hypothetical protein